MHEEEVTPTLDAAQQLRWFGRREPGVSTVYFADADCTERVAFVESECVPDSEQPTTAKESEAGDCGGLLGRHQLLEEAEQLFFANEGNCSPTNDNDVHGWRVGAPLDDSDFAESSTLDGGGDRLRHDIYTNPEGEPFLASGRVHDRQLTEVECRWFDPVTYSSAPSSSATFDCVPVDAATLDSRYQDPTGSQRTASRWLSDEASCPGEALYAYGQSMAAAITSPTAGEGGYGLDQDVCVPLSPSEPPGGGGGGVRVLPRRRRDDRGRPRRRRDRVDNEVPNHEPLERKARSARTDLHTSATRRVRTVRPRLRSAEADRRCGCRQCGCRERVVRWFVW